MLAASYVIRQGTGRRCLPSRMTYDAGLPACRALPICVPSVPSVSKSRRSDFGTQGGGGGELGGFHGGEDGGEDRQHHAGDDADEEGFDDAHALAVRDEWEVAPHVPPVLDQPDQQRAD